MTSAKERLSQFGTVVLVGCAVLITGLVVRRELFAPRPTAVLTEREVEGWQRFTAEGSHLGPSDAPVKIVVFSDFQCPFCATVTADIERLRAQDPERVTVVYRHFPIESIHPHAFNAALASECAGAQRRFEAYHNALFAAQAEIGTRSWRSFAETAGVPKLDEFDACVKDQRFAERVRRDLTAGKEAGVNSTPSFLFNGKLVMGVPGAQGLADDVRRELRR